MARMERLFYLEEINKNGKDVDETTNYFLPS